MKKAVVCLAEGFEEIEAVGTIDILRRAGIETVVVSVSGSLSVSGAHQLSVKADELVENTDFSGVDMIVLPGGMPGAQHLKEHKLLREKLAAFDQGGKWLGAICAAPMVLGDLGILEHRKATCYPGFENQLKHAIVKPDAVVEDQHVVTGKGPGFVFDFALKLVEKLSGKEKAGAVAGQLLLTVR
jgi:protein deglycase